MRSLLIISLAIIAWTKLFAQDSTELLLFQDAARFNASVKNIVYIDSSIVFMEPFGKWAKNGTVAGHLGEPPDKVPVQFKFSKAEIDSLNKLMARSKRVQWQPSLMERFIRISQAELFEAFDNRQDRTHPLELKFGASCYFYFSKPLFIRGGTVVVLRVLRMFGPSAGYSFLYIYERKGGRWVQKLRLEEFAI